MERIQRRSVLLVLFVILFFGLCTGSGARGQEERPKLTIEISVQKEEIVFKEGKKVTGWVPVEKTQKDDTLLYTITYTNVGQTVAQNASVVDPTPDGTLYVLGSATGAGAEVLCSIDGGLSYHEPPVKYKFKKPDGTLEERIAPAEMYTHIKWIIKKRVEPGASGQLSFKVKVK